MEKYHGFDKEFYNYLFDYLVANGGLRWQITVADLGTSNLTPVNELQGKYDPKHNLNLFRKQYGNMYEALKPIKDPFFVLDSSVVRMKKPSEVEVLFKSGSRDDVNERNWERGLWPLPSEAAGERAEGSGDNEDEQ